MRLDQLAAIAVAAVALAAAEVPPAFAACQDPNTNCMDKIGEAANDLKHSGSLSDAIDNVKAAFGGAKDCVTCAEEKAESGIKRFGSSTSPDE